MLEASWGEVSQILVRDVVPVLFEMIESGLHINRIPNSDDIGDQVEAVGLVNMVFRILLADTAAISRVQVSA